MGNGAITIVKNAASITNISIGFVALVYKTTWSKPDVLISYHGVEADGSCCGSFGKSNPLLTCAYSYRGIPVSTGNPRVYLKLVNKVLI